MLNLMDGSLSGEKDVFVNLAGMDSQHIDGLPTSDLTAGKLLS